MCASQPPGRAQGRCRHLVVIKAEGNDAPHSWLRLYPLAVTTLAEARVLRANDR
jgi:hypothetical protein